MKPGNLESAISDIDTISLGIYVHLHQSVSLFRLSADIQINVSLLILGIGRSNFIWERLSGKRVRKVILFFVHSKNI